MSTGNHMKLLHIGLLSLGLCLSMTETIDHRALAIPYLHPAAAKAQSERQGTTTIKGFVRIQEKIDLRQKSVARNHTFCSEKPINEELFIDPTSLGVKNVIVYLDRVDSSRPIDTEHHMIMTNKDCAFLARVGTISIGQQVDVTNEDPIMHNIHIRDGETTLLNVKLAPEIQPISKEIRHSGILTVQCALHDFMKGFIGVFPHPYHSQTDATGVFQIEDAPPGEYELKIWHEVLGTLQKTIMVPEGEPTIEVNLEYSPPMSEPRTPIILTQ